MQAAEDLDSMRECAQKESKLMAFVPPPSFLYRLSAAKVLLYRRGMVQLVLAIHPR